MKKMNVRMTITVLLAALVTMILTGCATTYEAERTDQNAGTETKLTVRTYREFPGGIKIVYNRETGKFELQAGENERDGDVFRGDIWGYGGKAAFRLEAFKVYRNSCNRGGEG